MGISGQKWTRMLLRGDFYRLLYEGGPVEMAFWKKPPRRVVVHIQSQKNGMVSLIPVIALAKTIDRLLNLAIFGSITRGLPAR